MKFKRIYLLGFMGCGKSTVGQILAKKLRWSFLDLDEEIQRGEEHSISFIFQNLGEAHFRELEYRYLKEASGRENTVVALGGGTFVDPRNRSIIQESGTSVWLKISLPTVLERIENNGSRPMFRNEDQLARLYHRRTPSYRMARVHISTDERTPEKVAEEVIGAVRAL